MLLASLKNHDLSSVKLNRRISISEHINTGKNKHWEAGFNRYLKEDGSKRNSLQYFQNSAEILAVSLDKNFASSCETRLDSRQERAKILAAGHLFFGEICNRILARFWLRGLLLPGES